MIKATMQNREKVIFLLANAFKDNKSVNYIIKPDKYRTNRIYALMEYSFDVCINFGEVYLSEDGNACALILSPGSKRSTLLSIRLDIKLIFNAIGIMRIGSALKRESAIKKLQLKQPHLYLWFIGVDLTNQHKGIGTKMLQEIINYAHTKSLPVCLETSTITNLPWYQTNGLEVYNELDLGYQLFFLKTNS